MKSFLQRFPVIIIYLLTSAALFAVLIFAFSSNGSGGEHECQNLSHTYTCSAEEANNSALAWAIMLQFFAQATLVPAAIILQIVHFLLRKKYTFFDVHPYWSVLLLLGLFFVLSIGVTIYMDFMDTIGSPFAVYRFVA